MNINMPIVVLLIPDSVSQKLNEERVNKKGSPLENPSSKIVHNWGLKNPSFRWKFEINFISQTKLSKSYYLLI